MTLENEICDSLQDLKYPNLDPILTDVSLLTHLQTFSSIISWVSNQLSKIDNLESTVNPIKDESQMVSFKVELNSLLRELNCPQINGAIDDLKNRLSIVNSLCGHLMVSRMNYVNRKSGSNQSMTIAMNESQTAKDLKTILITLGMGRPPNGVGSEVLFKKIKDKLVERLTQQNQSIEDSLLLPEGLTLSPEQWKCLEALNEELNNDYRMRREMLLRRCDCTVGSFTWKSDPKTDSNSISNKVTEVYQKERQLLSQTPNVTLADALAARPSHVTALIKGVVSNTPTECIIKIPETQGTANRGIQQRLQIEELHKYRIGSVPDRGGRPNEQPKPSKESFSQQQFQRDNPQRGRGRAGSNAGAGGGTRGGYSGRGGGASSPNIAQNTNRIQGSGWAQNSGQSYSGSGYDNQSQMRGYQQNYDNCQTGQQQRYQQNTAYQYQQQSQQHRNTNYDNNAYNEQNNKQSFDNYSNQSYDNNNRQYQQQSSGGYRGRGGGRRY